MTKRKYEALFALKIVGSVALFVGIFIGLRWLLWG